MDTTVRAYLLQEMEQQLGQAQMVQAAHLLIRYVEQLERTNPYLSNQQLEAQHLAALLVLDEEQAVRQVATAYLQASGSSSAGKPSATNQAELARLSSLTQELAPQIKPHENLVKYAELVGQLLRSPDAVDSELLQQSFPILGDLELRVPDGLVPASSHQIEGFPSLLTAEFDIAIIDLVDNHSATPILQSFEFTIATVQEPLFTALDVELKLDKIDLEVFQRLGRRLVEIERFIFVGALQKQTYQQIAEQSRYSELHVKDIGADELERYDDESPQHTVTIAPFFIGKYPITQAQWRVVAALPQVNQELEPDPASFKGDDRPVENVSWFDAVEFCDRLSRVACSP